MLNLKYSLRKVLVSCTSDLKPTVSAKMVLKMILRGGYIDVFEKKCSPRRLNDSLDVVCFGRNHRFGMGEEMESKPSDDRKTYKSLHFYLFILAMMFH